MNKKTSSGGFVLPSIIITAVFLTSLGILITQLAVNNLKLAIEDTYVLSSQLAADAGVDAGIVELNIDNDWPGTSGEVEIFNDGEYRTTYETVVTDVDSSSKVLSATGRTYKPVSDTEPRVSRTYVVDLTGLGPLDLGTFSVVTGVGGLFLENSAKIVAGDVYANGEIAMSNTAQIGTSLNPVNVRAAHAICPDPPDSSYPQVCSDGENGEPITLENNAHIYGEVQATNQTDDSGMSDPGLVAGSPPVEPLPDHDRDAQIAAVANSMSAAAASCDSNNATLIIPANTHVTGGDVSWGKKCDVVVQGDVWIDGNLEMTNTAEVIVDESVSDTLPVIMVDGSNGASFRNSTGFTANSSGVGVQLITYHSTAPCSPGCSDVTGVNLANSREYTTIYMQQSFSAPESILYARWTQLLIDNSGDIGALLGQTVKLRNNTTVTFGTSVEGGGGGEASKTWIINNYRRDT